MAKLIVLYKTPKDAAAFDKHYSAVHVPLAKKIPGLKKYDISKGAVGSPAGPNGVHLVATLYFDSLDAVKPAWHRPRGRPRRGILPTLPTVAQNFTFSIRKKFEAAQRTRKTLEAAASREFERAPRPLK
jgi:uncharacterized protein (TIGR02118 family)